VSIPLLDAPSKSWRGDPPFDHCCRCAIDRAGVLSLSRYESIQILENSHAPGSQQKLPSPVALLESFGGVGAKAARARLGDCGGHGTGRGHGYPRARAHKRHVTSWVRKCGRYLRSWDGFSLPQSVDGRRRPAATPLKRARHPLSSQPKPESVRSFAFARSPQSPGCLDRSNSPVPGIRALKPQAVTLRRKKNRA
jgi:hypothetical protein